MNLDNAVVEDNCSLYPTVVENRPRSKEKIYEILDSIVTILAKIPN